MVICAVDHREAHIFAGKLFGCLEAAKSRTDDDDVRFSCGRVLHSNIYEDKNVATSAVACAVSAHCTHTRQRRCSPLKTADTTAKGICRCYDFVYALGLMPKPIARSKTRKSVAKRFKITARGKVLRAHSSRRHLLSSKNAKRKWRLRKAANVDKTDVARVMANI